MPSRKSGAASKRSHRPQRSRPAPRDVAIGSAARREPEASAPKVEPRVSETLVVSHTFDSGEAGGEPYTATVRLQGKRSGIVGVVMLGDTFAKEERIDRVIPGTGPVTVTSWVEGLKPGTWDVTAELVPDPDGEHPSRRNQRSPARPEPLRRAGWSWRRWGVTEAPSGPIATRWSLTASLARSPAVQPGSYQVLATLAFVVGWVIQLTILASLDVSLWQSFLVTAASVAVGLAGAKVWYAILHTGKLRLTWTGGWAVDGFLVVGAVASVVFVLVSGVPAGKFYDASAPALFVGVAIGRVGCFLTGCCAGRCSNSRWAIWSSDRRVGARRIPTQLLESAAGLSIAAVAALLIAIVRPGVPGFVFLASFLAYLGVRQVLLRLRAERRDYSWERSALLTAKRP